MRARGCVFALLLLLVFGACLRALVRSILIMMATLLVVTQ